METVLYDYWRSSASYRVRIALGLLEIAHRRVPVNLLEGEHRGADNLARNPQGLVPTLCIDGLTLTQSLAIIEYLDETRGARFLPADAVGRARVRALSHAIAMEIHPVCNLSVARFATDAGGGGLTMQGWMQHFIPRGLAAFEEMLARGNPADVPGRFCHGDQVSMADICLIPQLYNADRWGVDLGPFARIRAIRAELESLPAVRAAHPDAVRPAD